MNTYYYYYYYLLIVISLWSSSNGYPLVDDKINHNEQVSTNKMCHRNITYNEIISSLTKTPCVVFIDEPMAMNNDQENHRRLKRDGIGGNVDIHALQTTVNEHRNMINYLMNNSVNVTVVSDAISDHHTRTGPILTSWRDITLLFVQIIIFSIIVYFVFCRLGCRPMDHMLRWILKGVDNRLQQQQQQQQPPIIPINEKAHRTKEEKKQQPIPTVSQKITRYYHHQSMSDDDGLH